MSSPSPTTSSSVGLPSLLFLLFLALKLTDVIDWSWWWVTAPLWAPAVFLFGVFVMTVGIVRTGTAIKKRGRR